MSKWACRCHHGVSILDGQEDIIVLEDNLINFVFTQQVMTLFADRHLWYDCV